MGFFCRLLCRIFGCECNNNIHCDDEIIANIVFTNVKAYDVEEFDVRIQENFKIELIDAPGLIEWFADADSVLQIDVDETGTLATVKATNAGISEIQLQFNGDTIKTLQVEVYDNIAVRLNPIVGIPVLK